VRTIDASGLVVAPGLVDLAVRLREPGHEHEGMLESEMAAAVAGGVTSLVCLPDTDPPLDEPGLVEMLKFRARNLHQSHLYPLGALTRGLSGEVLTEMAELTEAGCVGFSHAEVPLNNTLVLHRALQYASTFGYTTWLRAQDGHLGGGVAAKGALATRMGLSGVPVIAETIALNTLFELVRDTGARVHICRLSSAAGVELVRRAKAEGLPVTCDISINQLHLTDIDIGYFNAAMRLTPPLRQVRDRDALRAGARTTAAIGDAIGARSVPGHAHEKAAVVTPVGRPPVLRSRHQRLEISHHEVEMQGLEFFGVVEGRAHRAGLGLLRVEDLQVELLGPPVGVGPAASGLGLGECVGREWALCFV
jgi:dihydroorotase-like cyclic amidohydrolase